MKGRGEEGEKEAGGSGEDWGGSPHTALLSCKPGHLPLACFPPASPVESQTAQQMAWGSWALPLAELSWADSQALSWRPAVARRGRACRGSQGDPLRPGSEV